MPKTTTLQSEEAYLAAARARYRKRTRTPGPKGRPSLAGETLMMIHLASQRMAGSLTQESIMAATVALFTKLHETYPDCVAPTHNTLREYVKAYICYRRGLVSRTPFPPHIQHALATLPGKIQVDALLGFAGNVVSHDPKKLVPTIRGKRALAAADLTKRIHAIKSLSSRST